MKVNWTGGCAYKLLFNYVTPKDVSKNKDIPGMFDSSSDIPLQVKILSGTDDYYVLKPAERSENLRDTIWLVK